MSATNRGLLLNQVAKLANDYSDHARQHARSLATRAEGVVRQVSTVRECAQNLKTNLDKSDPPVEPSTIRDCLEQLADAIGKTTLAGRLDAWKDQADASRQRAYELYTRRAGPRNRQLLQAATYHRDAAHELLTLYLRTSNTKQVSDLLQEHRNYAEGQVAQLRRLPCGCLPRLCCFWHDAVVELHDRAGNAYRAALDAIEEQIAGTPTAKLDLLFGTTGDSAGSMVVNVQVKEGFDNKAELTHEQTLKVTAVASMAGAALAEWLGNVTGSAELTNVIRSVNTYQTTGDTTRSVTLTIDLSKPCYVYQLRTYVPLVGGSAADGITLFGGAFTSSKPLSAETVSPQAAPLLDNSSLSPRPRSRMSSQAG